MVVVGAVVAVVVIVVVATILILAFPGGTSYASTSDYNSSKNVANSAADNYTGGPWVPVWAIGVSTTSALSSSDSDFESALFACSTSSVINAPSTITFPATSGSAAAGTEGVWLLYYTSQVTENGLLVMVQGNSSVLMFTGSGCDFLSTFTNISSATVNSPAAAATVNANGGSAFLANNSVSLRFVELFSVLGELTWALEYSTCGFLSAGTGSTYLGYVNAVTGAFLSGSAQTGPCNAA